MTRAALRVAAAVVALAGALDAAEAGAQGGDALAPAANPGGPAAHVPETLEVKALREALTAEPAPDARARRLSAMGAEAWALLLATPSLSALADEVVEPALAAASDERLAEVGARLARNCPTLIPKLARRMTSGPRPPLVRALATQGEEAPEDAIQDGATRVGPLLADAAVRDGTAAFELALYGPDAVTGAARQTLASALGASGRDDAVDALTPLLDEEPDTALAAVQALGICPDSKGAAFPALVRSLAAPEPMVRRAAAQALGRLRAAEAVDALLAVLADPDADRPRRRAAPSAEAGAGPASPGGRATGASGGARGAEDESVQRDPFAAPPLPVPAGGVAMTVQVEAARALREITGDPRLPGDAAAARREIAALRAEADKRLPLLLAEVDSGDPQAAMVAARDLPRLAIRRDRIRPVLLRMLGASDAPTRALAASTLGAMREPLAIPALIDSLGDRDPDVWEAALGALRGITGKSLPARAEQWRRRNTRR